MKKDFLKNLLPSLTTDFILTYRISVVGIFIAGCLFVKFSIDSEKKIIENKVANTAEQIERITTSNIDYVKYQLYYAANQIRETSGDKNQIFKLLATFVTNINNQVDSAVTWNAFSWVDNSDRLVVDGVAGVLAKPINLTGRDYLPLAIKNRGKLVFGEPVKGALSQRLILPAGASVFSDRDRYFGTLVFGLDIEKILEKLEGNIGNETISFAFAMNKKIVFTSHNFNNENLAFAQQKFAEERGGDTNLHNKIIVSSQGLFDRNQSFSSFHEMREYPFAVLVIYNKANSHQQLLNIFFKQSFFMLVIAFACIILFKQIYRKIVQPVSSLSNFALRISQGDFSAITEKPKSKELENLHDALHLVKESLRREHFLTHQLESANKKISQENFNKTEFLASVSHELRNPLAAIISFAGFINEESEGPIKDHPEKYKDLGKDIEICTLDLIEFVNDLVDVNRAQSGEFSVNLSQKIDIADIIERSLKITRNFSQRKHIEIKKNIEDNLEPIMLDPVRIKQILVNLVSNSLKYSPENTEVLVTAKLIIDFDGSKKLQISIKDQGYGMTEEQVKRSTEKYSQIDNKDFGKVDSFGLGLALTKHLVQLQKGQFEIKSEPNKGTEVILTFFYF